MKLFALPLFFLLLALCGVKSLASPQSDAEGSVRRISATQAHTMMSELAEFTLLDVRSPQEFRGQRIEGALSIPANEISARAATLLPDKNRVILVYCQSGRRSAAAARELVRLGYLNVYDFGGIRGWRYGTVSN